MQYYFIGSTTANKLILEAMKRTSGFAKSNEADFMKMLREELAIKQAGSAKSHRRQTAKNEKRIAELNSLFRKTYKDFAARRRNLNRRKQHNHNRNTAAPGNRGRFFASKSIPIPKLKGDYFMAKTINEKIAEAKEKIGQYENQIKRLIQQ